MFFFTLLISLLFLAPTKQHTLRREHSRIIRSDELSFKGIPKFADLANDEKREIYHYEQTIAVKDSSVEDDKVRRCEVIEVYEEMTAKIALQNLTSLLNNNPLEVDMAMILAIMKDCDSVDDKIEENENNKDLNLMTPEEDKVSELNGPNPLLNGIFPGTNWCGLGDIAENYHDLGGLRNVDRCCRAHDLCPIKVYKHDTRYALNNTARYTKSHCTCDENFYNCLKEDNGWTAKIIGNLYFYVGKSDCIEGHPDHPEETMQFVKTKINW